MGCWLIQVLAQPIDVFIVPAGRWSDGFRCSGHVGPLQVEVAHLSVASSSARSEQDGIARFHHERPQDSGPEGHCT